MALGCQKEAASWPVRREMMMAAVGVKKGRVQEMAALGLNKQAALCTPMSMVQRKVEKKLLCVFRKHALFSFY